mgnify:CR=1 FL=1
MGYRRRHGTLAAWLFVCITVAWFFVQGQEKQKGSAENEKLRWGLYQIYWGHQKWIKQVDRQTQDLGARPDWILFFRDLDRDRGFPQKAVQLLQTRNIKPIISLELWRWGEREAADRDTYLKLIIDGEFDAFFTRWARDARKWGKTVYLRFGFEMNGDWFGWGQRPKQFKRAWRHVHALFADVGADNVLWVFSPNVLWGDKDAATYLHAYYPGDRVVDWVALDGYNFGDHYDQWHRWQSYQQIFERSLRALSQYEKPLMIAEIGCAEDKERKPVWIKNFLKHVATDKRIDGFIYYDHHDPQKNEPDWRLDSDTRSHTIFREWVQQNAN